MYNLNLENDETVIFEDSKAIVECNKEQKQIAVVITNKRILFLEDINKDTILEARMIARNSHTVLKLEPIDQILKSEIKECQYVENGTEIITDDKNIFIFNYDLSEFLKN